MQSKSVTRFLTLPTLALVLLLTGCASDRAVIGQAQQFHGGIEKAVIEDRELAGYIQKIGDRIIEGARDYYTEHPDEGSKESRDWMFSKDVRFHFVNSKTLNAFTTGGEHMYIYSELFRQSGTEDELAAVMAHEFAHIYGRHVQKGMNRQYAIMGAAAAAGATGYAVGATQDKGGEFAGAGAGLAMLAGQFVGMHYTRGDESEADRLGFEFYARAGYDPDKFDDFFERMIELGHDKGPEYLSDHPSLKSRADAARERAKNLPSQARAWRRPAVAQGAEFKRLQNRSQEVGAKMPSDESLEKTQKVLAAVSRSCLTPSITPDQKKAEQDVAELLRDSRPESRTGAAGASTPTSGNEPVGQRGGRRARRQ